MACSPTYSWFSEPGVMNQSFDILDHSIDNNQIFTDDFMGSIDEILGEDFLNTFIDPTSHDNMNNNNIIISVHSRDSKTNFCADPPPSRHRLSPESPPIVSESQPKRKTTRTDRAPVTSPFILNFGDANSPKSAQNSGWPLDSDQEEVVCQVNTLEEVKNSNMKNKRDRPQSQSYDHIISERKRRKLLSEQFLTLSGMVPGLKKMDKTSVLGATIKYMRGLQERAQMLEERLAKETVESAVLVRKSQIMMMESSADEEGSSDENYNQLLPEIEAKVCNNQALLKIHCEKQKGIMVKLLAAVEKLNLSVVHSNVSPFGNLILDITIVVEMDKECTSTANQIVAALHSALRTAAAA